MIPSKNDNRVVAPASSKLEGRGSGEVWSAVAALASGGCTIPLYDHSLSLLDLADYHTGLPYEYICVCV
ncbi:hypothetical protein HHK36_005169 [Tetracentron sinense]|uniref:Uncharacterized protein n=1 Tax=Tetracentron sinense TaxID=13715 RepID=A0A835DMK5_TETSI|nr:hypothetical protein HHK36_005169 [Tetracentron sinense]